MNNGGYSDISIELIQDSRLNAREIQTFMVLAMHCQNCGSMKCHRSEIDLAADLCRSVRVVQKSIAKLSRLGYISYIRRGRAEPNVYTLLEGFRLHT